MEGVAEFAEELEGWSSGFWMGGFGGHGHEADDGEVGSEVEELRPEVGELIGVEAGLGGFA